VRLSIDVFGQIFIWQLQNEMSKGKDRTCLPAKKIAWTHKIAPGPRKISSKYIDADVVN
jgi:hypothetical protein